MQKMYLESFALDCKFRTESFCAVVEMDPFMIGIELR